jgi:alpha-ketoglutarate-dependent taurine dioxygenase
MTAAAQAATSAGFTVTPSGAALGAEVGGVKVGPGLADADFQRIRDALLRHSVVVLRDQQ